MQTRMSSRKYILAIFASGAWCLTAFGMFLPWVTVTIKLCILSICLPEIKIYSSQTTFLQFLVPVNISEILPTLNHYVVSFIASNFFPLFNQYLLLLTRAAYVLFGSVIVLLPTLIVFALQTRGSFTPHRITAAFALVVSFVGLVAMYETVQIVTAIQQHVQGARTSLGGGFWMIGTGFALIGLLMLWQLLKGSADIYREKQCL